MVIKQNNYMLGKIKDIAKELYFPKDKDKLLFRCFRECDFALIDNQDIDLNNQDIDLDEIYHNSTGWYGIKKINTGFDAKANNDWNLFADYYGGGCGVYRFIFNNDDTSDIISNIEEMIMETLSYQEGTITRNMIIICEVKMIEF